MSRKRLPGTRALRVVVAATVFLVILSPGVRREGVIGFAGARAADPAATSVGRQEQERRRIQEQLGLDPQRQRPPQPPTPPPPSPPPSPAAPGGPATEKPGGAPSGEASRVSVPGFAGRIHEGLLTSCRTCHAPGAPAGATRLVLTGDRGRDYSSVRPLVNAKSPRLSLLLAKATGVQHGGGATISTGSDLYRRLLPWIAAGAPPSDTVTPSSTAPSPSGGARPPVTSQAAPANGGPRRRGPPGAAPSASPPSGEQPREISSPSDIPPVIAVPAGPPALSVQGQSSTPVPPSSREVEASPSAVALHHEINRGCTSCHRSGGMAGASRFLLTGDLKSDLLVSGRFVSSSDPVASPLLTKAAGQSHGGGAIWAAGSTGQAVALAWLRAGAPDGVASPPAALVTAPAGATTTPIAGDTSVAREGSTPIPAAPGPPPAISAPPVSGSAPGHPSGTHGTSPGLALSFLSQTLTLNGRFDLNLERRNFRGNPFTDEATTAFQSYHHFLFLSRTSTEDPFTLTAEVVNLEFYEMAVRLSRKGAPFTINARAGKVLVPFGTEPLFHQQYGGHAGFDQRVLPAFWTAEGAVLSGATRRGRWSAGADLFAVKGHALRRADGVLNLKNDFATVDDVRVALGARVALSWGPLSAFYSTYTNDLGFGRRLFMQGLDIGMWRWRGLSPVLDRLVLSAGLLRADVSGGGAGRDYYHFASYWLARVYLRDWLHLQYRQGLRTFENRRGVIADDTRFDASDGSTHNLALAARFAGLQVALAYYLNFEKSGEINDDLLRLMVAYEF